MSSSSVREEKPDPFLAPSRFLSAGFSSSLESWSLCGPDMVMDCGGDSREVKEEHGRQLPTYIIHEEQEEVRVETEMGALLQHPHRCRMLARCCRASDDHCRPLNSRVAAAGRKHRAESWRFGLSIGVVAQPDNKTRWDDACQTVDGRPCLFVRRSAYTAVCLICDREPDLSWWGPRR